MKKAVGLICLVLLAIPMAGNAAPAQDSVDAWVAVARATGNVGVGRNSRVEIVIERYSSDEEREAFIQTFFEGGPGALIEDLQMAVPVGRVRFGAGTSYPLSFARQIDNGDGTRTIRVVTDRPIHGFEALNQSTTMRYAFAMADFTVDGDNTGEGAMAIAANLKADPAAGTFTIEIYDSAPIRLGNVRPLNR